jgi:hypothetical protein
MVFIPLRLAQSICRAKKIEVLKYGHLPVHRKVIRHVSDLPAHRIARVHYVFAKHADAALLGLKQRRENLQRRGLARAIGTDKAVDALTGDGEAHVLDGDVIFVRVPQIADINDVWVIHRWQVSGRRRVEGA